MLYTLLSDVCDNAPNSCRLALRHCDENFRAGEPVQFFPNGIAVGPDKWITTTHSQPWQPARHQLTIGQYQKINWQAWYEEITRHINNSTSLFYYHGENIFYREMANQLRHYRDRLLTALKYNHDLQPAISGLLGLGIGLTPSGDDWLTGFCAIWLLPCHPGNKYKPQFLSAVEKWKGQTTLLSEITLRAAINQRYRESIDHLITQIVSNDISNITGTLNDIKKIGSSSGCDMLCGIADACALTTHCGGKYDNQDSNQKKHLF